MHKLLAFIRSAYVVVLFVLCETVVIGYYARSTPYTEARLLAHSNHVAGSMHTLTERVRGFFSLARENRALLGRVAALQERLAVYEEAETKARLDAYLPDSAVAKYHVVAASVVFNSIDRQRNFLILDRGRRDGIVEEMSVLSPDGAMVGYVIDCTDRYAIAMSVLNTSFRASGRLVGSDYFGSIYWDGTDAEVVELGEWPKYVVPQQGERVVTTGFTQFFPPDTPIGTVESTALNETQTAYTVRVRLAAPIARLGQVLLLENRDLPELRELQQSEKIEDYTRIAE